MNLENFHTFLSEPANLHRVSYNELKSLVAEYPYSANLRILLLLKSKLDKHPELAHNLKLAATYSPNRSILYTVMHDQKLMEAIREEAIVQEEVLELKDLSEVESLLQREEREEAAQEKTKALERTIPMSDISALTSENNWSSGIFDEDVEPVTESKNPSVISIDSLLSSISDEPDEEANIFGDDAPVEQEEENEKEDELQVSHGLLLNFATDNISGFSKMLENFELTSDDLPLEIELPISHEVQPPIAPKSVKPQPKNSFSSWLTQVERDLNRELEVPDINKNLELLEAGKLSKEPEPEAIEPVEEEMIEEPKFEVEAAVEEAAIIEPEFETEAVVEEAVIIEPENEEEIAVFEEIIAEPKVKLLKAIQEISPPKIEEPAEEKEEETESEKKKINVKAVAKKSLSLNNEIVSETLAKLLVQQERYQKAINMYEKLILKFPELESTFSAEIERIRGL